MKNRGSVLILALWSLCLISVFAITISYGIRQKLTLGNRLQVREELSSLAYSAIAKAKAMLKEDNAMDPDTLGEEWGPSTASLKTLKLAGGTVTIGTAKQAGLIDEERKINLNKADVQSIRRIIQFSTGLSQSDAEALAYHIVDWRDGDSNYGSPEDGAEDKDYEDEKVPYSCKDALFEVFDELLLVKGMNRAIFDKLQPWTTVYGLGSVNINTASEEVLSRWV